LQLYDNAMVSAGLVEDARPMINRLNDLLTSVLAKHWSLTFYLGQCQRPSSNSSAKMRRLRKK